MMTLLPRPQDPSQPQSRKPCVLRCEGASSHLQCCLAQSLCKPCCTSHRGQGIRMCSSLS